MEALASFVKKMLAHGRRGRFTSPVARVVVDRVIARSVNKTDPQDAQVRALYLAKGLFTEVAMKDNSRVRSPLRSSGRWTQYWQNSAWLQRYASLRQTTPRPC